jgi:hypothetical protein
MYGCICGPALLGEAQRRRTLLHTDDDLVLRLNDVSTAEDTGLRTGTRPR